MFKDESRRSGLDVLDEERSSRPTNAIRKVQQPNRNTGRARIGDLDEIYPSRIAYRRPGISEELEQRVPRSNHNHRNRTNYANRNGINPEDRNNEELILHKAILDNIDKKRIEAKETKETEHEARRSRSKEKRRSRRRDKDQENSPHKPKRPPRVRHLSDGMSVIFQDEYEPPHVSKVKRSKSEYKTRNDDFPTRLIVIPSKRVRPRNGQTYMQILNSGMYPAQNSLS